MTIDADETTRCGPSQNTNTATSRAGSTGSMTWHAEVGHRPTPELSAHVLDVLHWLDGTLGPHIAWEEAWLYPEIDARTGTPWATRAARFDHRQIREMAAPAARRPRSC